MTATLKSVIDFSNFFDHTMFMYQSGTDSFFSVKGGAHKQIKLPPQMKAVILDAKILSRQVMAGSEKYVLHIFRLGDGNTLLIQDPGTGTVLNSFIMSLITLSSNVCGYNPTSPDGDMNKVLLDKLVAEFDKEKKKFSITDKRQKEEIIILEEQAKDAYEQIDKQHADLKSKDKEIAKLKGQLSDLAEAYKNLEKNHKEVSYTSDYNAGVDLKKKNDILKEDNAKLVEAIKRAQNVIEDHRTDLLMVLTEYLDSMRIRGEDQVQLINSVNEIFSDNNDFGL